jgi:predicted PurR-regulated permease PerM
MALTLNQLLFIILTFAAVVAIVFLIMFLIQLRRAAVESIKTLAEIRELIGNLNDLEKTLKDKLDDVGQIMEASKKTVRNLSEASVYLTTRVLSPVTRYWPLIYPLFSIFWKTLRKKKEKKNG